LTVKYCTDFFATTLHLNVQNFRKLTILNSHPSVLFYVILAALEHSGDTNIGGAINYKQRPTHLVCPRMVFFSAGETAKHDMVVEVSIRKYHDAIVLPTSDGGTDMPATSLSILKQSQIQ